MSIELNSFTNLIEENKLRFYKTAKAILKNDDDVYDALQEALMSIYQNFRQLKDLKLITILYYYDDYSVSEISKIVDIPVGTVKSRLSRAREILKNKLGKEEF